MDFRILGPLEVLGDHGAVTLGGRKPRAVLAVLLLHANKPVSPERLATALWGEDAPAGAVRTVQVHISRLRKALGDGDVVTTTPAGYQLRVLPGELDAQRFEQLVEEGRRALNAGRAKEAAILLREAAGLWRGPPLADLAFEPFAQREIERLEEQRLEALELRVEADAAAGRHAELVSELGHLVAEYPTRERLAGQLMVALYRCGRQAEALDAYRETHRKLVEEIGVEPGSELRALHAAILRHDPTLDLEAAEELPHELEAAATAPLAGRDADVEWLSARWEEAAAGGRRLIVVAGPLGMGKTRLAAELACDVHGRGAAVRYASGLGPAQAALDAIERARATTRRLLLVVDDADRTPAEVLDAVRELPNDGALILATATNPEALAELEPSGVLFLKRLGSEGIGAIAALYAPDQAAENVPVEWLLGATDGVPRRVHDLASQWARREATERVSAVAGRAAAGRAELRSMERELAGGVVQLQTARELSEPAAEDGERVVCPFKGLASFEAADAPYFFGRERLVAELVARLVGAPLLGVVGPSGSGKSSAVRAGLLPALAGGVLPGSQDWPQVLIRPGEHPARELESATADVGPGRFVLAVDQFEETFTVCRDEDERSRFIAELVRAARAESGAVVVVALRADFYGRCAAYPPLSRLLASNHVLVGAMRHAEIERAIVGPAQRVGLHVEGELVDALVRDVEDEPGALPLLSTALLELWQRREGRRMRLASYEAIGGVQKAVARLAEDGFGRLDPGQQTVARTVLLRLAEVEPEGGVERRRLPLEELEAGRPDIAEVIGLLAGARLLTVSAGTVEFAHEALLREWPRLRTWIEDDREHLRVHRNLRSAAHEWLRLDQDEGALYRGSRLAEAREWSEHTDLRPTDLERDFLSASLRRERRDRGARRRRLRLAFGGLVAALAVITAVAIVAVYQGREAERQRDIAASRELAARATSFLDVDPALSLALALQALERRETEQAANVLRQSTLAARGLSTWPAHDGRVNAVEPSRDGRLVATAGQDGLVRVWDLNLGRAVTTIKANPGSWALGASISPDGRQVATVGDDGTVALWDLNGKEKRVLLRLGRDYGNAVEFSPDGSRLLVPAFDGTIHLVPVEGGGPVRALRGHTDLAWTARFSFDGTRAVSASDDRTARIWNLADGTSTVLSHPEPVLAADFSPDGRRVATAGHGGILRIWDANGGGSPLKIPVDDQALNGVRFSEDGKRLITSGEDGVVRVHDVNGGPALAELRGHRGLVQQAAFVPGSNLVISAGQDGTLRRWSPATAATLQAPVTTASFSPDGKTVLNGGADGVLRLWDLSAGSVTELPGHAAPSYPRFSRDGERIVSASVDGSVRLWDSDSRRSRVAASEDGLLFGATFDRAGRRIAFGGARETITIQRLGGGDRVVLKGHEGAILAVAFDGDGTHLASASDDGTVRLWDTATGKLERTLRGHGQSVTSVAYSPDGRRVLSAGADGTVRVWGVDGGPTTILRGHEGPVSSAAFDPTGRRVVSAGQDGTVRVWSAEGGETLVVLFRHEGPATSAEFSSDGRRVVSAGDGVVRISTCEVCGPLSAVLRLARTRAERELSPVERQRLLPSDD
jgi:WD40 repeat protein/DNA-binding SARP family transcriptional activator